MTQRQTELRMQIDLYAIRHKPTGGWIPARRGRGGSHDEPRLTGTPRLFTSAQSARSFLVQWLKGIHVRHVSSQTTWGGFPETGDEVVIRKVESRKKEDMEIVLFQALESELVYQGGKK